MSCIKISVNREDLFKDKYLLEAYLMLVDKYDEELIRKYLQSNFSRKRIRNHLVRSSKRVSNKELLFNIVLDDEFFEEYSGLAIRLVEEYESLRTRDNILQLFAKTIQKELDMFNWRCERIIRCLKKVEFDCTDVIETCLSLIHQLNQPPTIIDYMRIIFTHAVLLTRSIPTSSSLFEKLFIEYIKRSQSESNWQTSLILSKYKREELSNSIIKYIENVVRESHGINRLQYEMFLEKSTYIDTIEKLLKNISETEKAQVRYCVQNFLDRVQEDQIYFLIDNELINVINMLYEATHPHLNMRILVNAEKALSYILDKNKNWQISMSYLHIFASIINRTRLFRKKRYIDLLIRSYPMDYRNSLKELFKKYAYFRTLDTLVKMFESA